MNCRGPTRSAFWPLLWLAVVCIACKIVIRGVPSAPAAGVWLAWAHELAILVHQDVLVCLAAGAIWQTLLCLSTGRPRLHAAIWGALVALCTLAAVYTAGAVPAFEFLRVFPTWALLDLLGGLRGSAAAAARFAPAGLWAFLAMLAVVFPALAVLSDRLFRPRASLRRRLARFACIVALVLYIGAARRYVAAGKWQPRHDDPRSADNAAWVMIESVALHIAGAGCVGVNGRFHPDDLDDFRPAALRPAASVPTVGIARGPRNVILIVLESVATRYMSVYGCRWPTTPTLQAEARNSLVFDSVYCPATNSGQSLVALILSLYAPMSWREWVWHHPDMPGHAISDVLHQRGYRTAFISSTDFSYANGLRFLQPRGFDTLWDYRQSGREKADHWDWGIDDGHMFDMMFQWIRLDRARRPFFIFGWTQQTHYPFPRPAGWQFTDFLKESTCHKDYGLWRGAERFSALGEYLNALHYVDAQFARLFAFLRQENLADDTIVVIVGDHGETFGTHGSYGHSGRVYQEDVNVPCIFWSPALFRDAGRRSLPASLVDIAPTIVDLLNISSLPSWQGRSMFSDRHPGRAYFYGARDSYLLGVREGNYKYIANTSRNLDELYDLSADPLESVNIARQHPDICRRFRGRLAAWVHHQMNMDW